MSATRSAAVPPSPPGAQSWAAEPTEAELAALEAELADSDPYELKEGQP